MGYEPSLRRPNNLILTDYSSRSTSMHSEDVEDAKLHPTDSAARQMADMPKIILSEIYLMHLSD